MSMTETEVLEASINAEDLLASRCEEREVLRILCKMYSISKEKAKSILKIVYQRWREEAEETIQAKKKRQLKVLSHLYYHAFKEKQYDTCLKIEQFRAKIEGTFCEKSRIDEDDNQPINILEFDQEFQDRTVEELEYFAKNGRWPENTTH